MSRTKPMVEKPSTRMRVSSANSETRVRRAAPSRARRGARARRRRRRALIAAPCKRHEAQLRHKLLPVPHDPVQVLLDRPVGSPAVYMYSGRETG